MKGLDQMVWWQVVLQILPWVVTAIISVVALRNTRKLKELEIKDNERAREFELQRQITVQAIESMKEGCFRLGKQATRFARFVSKGRVDDDGELVQQMQDDLDFIEMNKPFFPLALREEMHIASSQLANLIGNSSSVDGGFQLEIFKKALPIVRRAKASTESFIDRYNLFSAEK